MAPSYVSVCKVPDLLSSSASSLNMFIALVLHRIVSSSATPVILQSSEAPDPPVPPDPPPLIHCWWPLTLQKLFPPPPDPTSPPQSPVYSPALPAESPFSSSEAQRFLSFHAGLAKSGFSRKRLCSSYSGLGPPYHYHLSLPPLPGPGPCIHNGFLLPGHSPCNHLCAYFTGVLHGHLAEIDIKSARESFIPSSSLSNERTLPCSSLFKERTLPISISIGGDTLSELFSGNLYNFLIDLASYKTVYTGFEEAIGFVFTISGGKSWFLTSPCNVTKVTHSGSAVKAVSTHLNSASNSQSIFSEEEFAIWFIIFLLYCSFERGCLIPSANVTGQIN